MTAAIAEEFGRIPMSPFLKATLARAADYAAAQMHREVTLEHLLLALAEDPEASIVLKSSQVDIPRLMSDVSNFLGRMDDRVDAGSQPAVAISNDLRRILEASAAAASQGRRREINGAIVLAAIVGDAKSPSAHMLRSQGLTFEQAIRALQQAASVPQPAAGRPASQPVPPAPRAATADDVMASARERVVTRNGPPAPMPEGAQPPFQPASGLDRPSDTEPATDPIARRMADAAQDSKTAPAPPLRDGTAEQFPTTVGRSQTAPPQQPAASPAPSAPHALPPSPPNWAPMPAPAPPPQRQNPFPPMNGMRPPAGPAPLPPFPPPSQIGGAHPAQGGYSPPPPPAQRGAPAPWADPALPRGPQYDDGMARLDARRPQAPVSAPAASAAPQQRRAGGGTHVQAGQLVENIPRKMRVGIPVIVEARMARAEVKAIAEGLQGDGAVYKHEITVTKAMSVRLRAPNGGFTIETASPETQWIENVLGLMSNDYASWRWSVTAQSRGKRKLQLVISARTAGTDGLTAETALPDQIIDVAVGINYVRTFAKWGTWLAAAIAGGLLSRFGDSLFEFGKTLLGGSL